MILAPVSSGSAGAFLTRTGRVWLFIESWLVGPWVGLYRLIVPRPACPADKDAPLPAGYLLRAQLPFLISMSLLAVAWALGAPPRPAGFEKLVTIIGVTTGIVAVSLAWRSPWIERLALVAQIFVLDQYFKVLMRHCSHLATYYDQWLFALDQRLFGTWPIALGNPQPGRMSEYWALVYSLFILYLFSSLFMNACGRSRRFAASYFAGVTLLYGTAYLGYVWLPARGPYAIEGLYATPLPPGKYMDVLHESFKLTDCFSGAFPSLHVGAVTYMLGVDWIFCRDRFFAYLPLALSIAVSTVVLRMHYIIDLVAGALLAIGCVLLCARLARGGSSSSS